MATLFYRNLRLLILTILIIVVWGVSSFLTLPRLEDPELTSRFAVITTFWSGADAEQIETLITEKIEEQLSEIEEIKTTNSTSVVMGSTRHVVATTLTTMIGFVPLLVQGGLFWPPLAIAIAGGVGGSTLVALYLVPCSYLLIANFGTLGSRE
ncbi:MULTISPECIES: efflux RND transporter permease subunit [unclassified Okeania]|uniref:efflux RND transporter permease subunit n=1 Tax=unclassified Okeania TaxID=2634635 RepID=UPI00257ECB5C|nr:MULTISPECIES: efflux RND transporter permease subunit [unclassified Okeania]